MITRAKNLATFMRNRRQELGQTQNDLAYEMGLTIIRKGYQTISNVERSTVQLPAKHIANCAKALRVDPEFIVNLMVQDYRDQLLKEIK